MHEVLCNSDDALKYPSCRNDNIGESENRDNFLEIFGEVTSKNR